MKEIFDALDSIKKLVECGILIGSRRWGGWTPESDWDYVVSHDDVDFAGIIPYNPFPYNENRLYNEYSFKIHLDEECCLNFIVYKTEEEKNYYHIVNKEFDRVKGETQWTPTKEQRNRLCEETVDFLFNSHDPDFSRSLKEDNLPF